MSMMSVMSVMTVMRSVDIHDDVRPRMMIMIMMMVPMMSMVAFVDINYNVWSVIIMVVAVLVWVMYDLR